MNPFEDMYKQALSRARLYLACGNERGFWLMVGFASWLLDRIADRLK